MLGRECSKCFDRRLLRGSNLGSRDVFYVRTGENTYEASGVLLKTKCTKCGHEELMSVDATFTVKEKG